MCRVPSEPGRNFKHINRSRNRFNNRRKQCSRQGRGGMPKLRRELSPEPHWTPVTQAEWRSLDRKEDKGIGSDRAVSLYRRVITR